MPDEMDWLIVGDFNLIRKLEDRNRPSGSVGDMMMFSNAISSLGLVEIPLHGRKFTWTNKQTPPLFLKGWIVFSLLSTRQPGILTLLLISWS